MKLGLLFAVVGAIGVVLGCTVAPWFISELLNRTISGVDLMPGQIVLGAGAVGGLFAILALVFHRRMLSVVTLVSAFVVGIGLIATYILYNQILVSMLEGDAAAQVIAEKLAAEKIVGAGFWYTLASFGVLFIGGMMEIGAVHTWGKNTRFLRVSLLWNGTAVKSQMLTEPRDIEVGRDAHTGLVVPTDVLPARFKMFAAHSLKGDYDLILKEGLHGTVSVGDKKMTAEEAFESAKSTGGHIRITGDDWGKLDFGDMSLLFQYVRPGLPGGGLGRFMFDTWVLASASLAMLLLLGSVAYLCWAYNPQYPPYKLSNPVLKVVSIDPSLLEKEEKKEEDEGKTDDTEAKKAEGDEGKFGDPDEPPEKVSKVPKMDGKMVSKIDPKKVGLVDILQSNQLQQMSAMSNILSNNTASLSSKLAIAMAGAGSDFVLGHGSGGMGFRGTGTGGGGTDGFGRIHGLGKIDTGGGLGHAATLGMKERTKVAAIKIGSGDSTGFCEKGDIANNVRRRASAIRACYEERLQVNNSLQGKLTARWTIALDGRVSVANIGGSTLKDGSVGECVLRVIRRMHFAKPNGGVCIVQWPFVFSPGN